MQLDDSPGAVVARVSCASAKQISVHTEQIAVRIIEEDGLCKAQTPAHEGLNHGRRPMAPRGGETKPGKPITPHLQEQSTCK
jgi:hypothetical protein